MKMNVEFSELNSSFDVDFGEFIETVKILDEVYEGEYDVIPSMEEQTLETKDKIMQDDVTVKPVPVYRVSNNAGGITVYIARGEKA